VSHIPGEVSRLSCRLWSLARRHVAWSVTALFYSSSKIFVQSSSMLVVEWCGDLWQHQEWEIFILSKAS